MLLKPPSVFPSFIYVILVLILSSAQNSFKTFCVFLHSVTIFKVQGFIFTCDFLVTSENDLLSFPQMIGTGCS